MGFYARRIGWQWWLVALALAIVAGKLYTRAHRGERVHKERLVALELFCVYVVVLFAATVFTRTAKGEPSRVNLDLVGTIVERFIEGGSTTEILVNAVMLFPTGLLIPLATGWGSVRTLLVSFALTLGVETLEYVMARGYFELSDIVLNMLGAAVGYAVYALGSLFP